jgi:hypothetical protein
MHCQELHADAHQTLSLNIFQLPQCTKHATFAARDADEMGGGAREMMLGVIFRFRCRNNSGRIYKLTGFTFRRRKFFFRRQSDSSLIVGRIIDPRP